MVVRSSCFLPLCIYLFAVLECESHIVSGVDRHEIHQSAPKVHIEFLHQAVLRAKRIQEDFDFCLPCLFVGDSCGDLIVPSLGSIVPSRQSIVAFLVFHLVEGNVCVFINAFFHQIRNHSQFFLKGGGFGFQSACVERRKHCPGDRINDRSLLGYQLIDR